MNALSMMASRAKCLGIALSLIITHSASPAVAEDLPLGADNRARAASGFEETSLRKPRKSDLVEGRVRSTLDGTNQPLRYWVPKTGDQPRPVLIFLHAWQADHTQFKVEWLEAATRRDWIYIQPNFRGPNNNPDAGGSLKAQQDILDAANWAVTELNGDPTRVYLAGASGGGHMAMLMAGRHPEKFSAVSAWVGISNLAEWYQFHTKGKKIGLYASMVSDVCGGPPNASPEVDHEYHVRSPINWASKSADLPIDLAAGVHDGRKGSVPIRQTLNYFNVIAASRGSEPVSDQEISELEVNAHLLNPLEADTSPDQTFGRDIHLRRFAGNSRVTIFEGGHEGLPEAACAWLEGQVREISLPVNPPKKQTAKTSRE